MAGDQGDKKHFATDRRREKAREDGQVTKSADLSSAAMLVIALLCLRWLGPPLCQRIASGMIASLSSGVTLAWTVQDATNRLLNYAALLAFATLPVLSVMFIAGVVVNIGQTGLLLTPAAVQPKLKNVSILSGFGRILSVRGLMRLGFGIFKVLVVTVVAYVAVRVRLNAIMMMWSEPVPVLSRALFEHLFDICLWIAVSLLVLGIVEYAFQKWRHEEDLKMTDQELRDEMKESQGDPQMQAKRKQMQRQMMMQRINTDVPTADVVITNPTELAIAISYKPQEMIAPIVLAKGAGAVAQKIRKIALENGVPVVERKPLAQFLYKSVDVGAAVPAEQYQAVAEVLRYVYQLKGKKLPKAA
jgi:flagellar biosynthetic protein FlhB